MAIKQLMLSKKIEQRKATLAEFMKTKDELDKRTADLEASIDEAKSDEEMKAVEEETEKLDADQKAFDEKKSKLEGEIADLEGELEQLNSKEPINNPTPTPAGTERNKELGGEVRMRRNKMFGMDMEQRNAFFKRDDVKGFITEIREIKTRGITNGGVTIPDVMLDILRNNMEQYSKLIKYVSVKPVNGTGRQNIVGAVPEGVWMEAAGALNELDMSMNQVEVDGYMVGGIIWVPNSLLEDSDLNLGTEVMEQLGQCIGKGVDRGLLFGSGVKMPLGISTRLAQTAKPDTWGTYAPTWVDLHTSNVLKLNIDGTTGAAFYASLIAALGVAKPDYSDGQCFWVMNRTTHIKLMTKALAFDAAAALVAGVKNQMPIIGGDIVEIEMLGDNEIIGGFGSVYLLAERAGSKIEQSEHARFKEMQTGFRGYARYDGMPVFGEAFVMVSFDNTDAVTTSTFPIDYANTELGALGVTSAAGTLSGDTLITVTGAEVSGTTLGYKVAGKVAAVNCGDSNVGYTTFTSPDDITAATGKIITVVEFDAAGRAIKVGSAQVVAKA